MTAIMKHIGEKLSDQGKEKFFSQVWMEMKHKPTKKTFKTWDYGTWGCKTSYEQTEC